jgi:hypothetical protein
MDVLLLNEMQTVHLFAWSIASGFAGAAVGAAATLYWAVFVYRRQQMVERQHRVLYAAQEAAVQLRAHFAWHGNLHSSAGADSSLILSCERDVLLCRLQQWLDDIDEAEVVSAFNSWKDYAARLRNREEGLSLYEEERRWAAALEIAGAQARQLYR